MEQQQKKKEEEEAKVQTLESTSQQAENSSDNNNKDSFEEMSVDELNSLTAEQRRDQMLQALQKRTGSP
jgi:coupling of ubiquitin conjugation to ER degradation protein 1